MGKEEVTDKLASGTISRRGALKLLGGTALGLLVLPAFPCWPLPPPGSSSRCSQRCSQVLILRLVAAVGEPARSIFWGDGR